MRDSDARRLGSVCFIIATYIAHVFVLCLRIV